MDRPGDEAPGDGHVFDAASRDADADADATDDADGSVAETETASNRLAPDEGRIDIVAEPVRYRRGPVYALLAVALLPALGLFWLHRWADTEADAYELELARVDDERATSLSTTDVPATIEPPGSLPDPGADDDTGGDEIPAVDLTTAILDYRRAPRTVGSVADARALATALSDFTERLPFGTCFAATVDGVRVAASGSGVPLVPASVQKLVTAAVALDVLGASHTFETSIAAPTPVDGVVDGDIYLIGGGDPLLTSDDFPIGDDTRPAFDTTSFDVLADAVAAAGITRVRGTVIGDGTRYDDEFAVPSWSEGVAGVEAGPYDALMANDARVLGRSGRESDPNVAAAREFVRLLGDRGVRVDNGWASGSRSTLVPIIGTVTSAPLGAIVEEMLVTSDNDTAELLVKEIGFQAAGEGSRAAGVEVMRSWLTEQGIATLGVELVDGSGLSNDNRLTCEAVVAVLNTVDGDVFQASLPVAAETGTLADEFVDTAVAGRLRAKTGTLNVGSVDPPSVKTLAGYLPADDASAVVFALLSNTPGITQENSYQTLWNGLAERLAIHPGGPSTAELGPDLDQPDADG